MTTLDYRNHARAKPIQALVYRTLSKSEPALEGLTRGYVVSSMIQEREHIIPGMRSLVASAARRLNQREDGKDKWSYTKKHCVEVGFISFVIAKEAEAQRLFENSSQTPDIYYIGGILHDIGKTFLPMSLIVKELGIDFGFFRLFEGARMNDIERRVLRDEHLSAGTRYVRMFGGNGEIKTILDMVGLHHVMYNGKDSVVPSYPTLFKGEELPFHARVAKTADFLSAVLPRHYKVDSWVLSFRTAIAYAIAVAGRELDPVSVRCFLTGTHAMRPEEADALIVKLRHPLGQEGISDFKLMKEHVARIIDDPEFARLACVWNIEKLEAYEDEAEAFARRNGFPVLNGLSPLSIKNKYAHA